MGQVEVDTYDVTRVTMGINPYQFKWKLHPGETFQTPECVLVYSEGGLNGMSQTFHTLYQNRLVRGKWHDPERPILINNWEATYFDFNEERILKIAETAKEVGIELLVLDDGWFGERHDDTSSLGDWFVNKQPNLQAGLKDYLKKSQKWVLSLDFGLSRKWSAKIRNS